MTEAEVSMVEGSSSSNSRVIEARSFSDSNNNTNIMMAPPPPSPVSDSVSAASPLPPVRDKEIILEAMFVKLDPAKKWILSTGKCVDNELYMFGLQCNQDHPSKSLIMDPDDANYTEFNVFTPAELEEIRTYREKASTNNF